MRVLITRPQDDARRLAAELCAVGHRPILSPLMEIRFRDGPDMPLGKYQAVLATSANGIRALARRTPERAVTIFAVGPQTAAAAQAAGFKTIRNAAGDAAALAEAVLKWAEPKKAPLLHVAGREHVGHLAESLREAGFSVESAVLYDAIGTSGLSNQAREALVGEQIDAVMLFSPRSARLFAEHVLKAALEEKCRGVAAVCISEAAAAPLQSLPLKIVRVAHHPDQRAMLALLDEIAAAP